MDKATEQTGLIFNIQKYSVHDGPGIRTVVFMKGCPLKCNWCSNPESQSYTPQLAYNVNNCIGCGLCVAACPYGAIRKSDEKGIFIHRDICRGNCTEICTSACLSQALIVYGKQYTVDEVLRVVEQDMPFYKRSGGGMTISGGEPLAQTDFSLALLREARSRHIRTSIETSGCVAEETLLTAAEYLNHAMFDIKHMDDAQHRKGTGAGNNLILRNFVALVTQFPQLPVLVRTPIIPGFNDSIEVVEKIADFVRQHNQSGLLEYELLPYHRLGTQKYSFLQRESPMGDAVLDNSVFQTLQAETGKNAV